MAMKVETGSCTACGAKNSKFVEKCYKCHAVLPWGAGYRAPAPQPQPTQLVTPAPVIPAHPVAPPRPIAPPAFDPLAPPPARTVMYPDSSAPSLPASSPAVAPPPYQGETATPPPYSEAAYPNQAYPNNSYPTGIGPLGPLICQTCGYSGHAQTESEGSTTIGIVLCLLFFLPGLLYFAWQASTKHENCPQCRSRALVPLHSPQGQFSAQHFYGQ